MKRAILQGRTPSLFLLQYKRPDLLVQNLLLIPHFALTVSILEERKPLSPRAQRAGWVGCNFLLDRVPPDAQIRVIYDGNIEPPARVRDSYAKLRPLEKRGAEKRGWTLDVLTVVRSLGKAEFSLKDVYQFEGDLARLHPANRNIQPKIRQQLQVVRDMGLLEFLEGGTYRLR